MERMAAENHLTGASSPYLLQHARQPVDWYPWREEAFEKARREDKPVFLSIGYSTCHWCHVMARESFADPEIAALLNRSFVAVKVDREERPDIDSAYMAVCQAVTGSGGWPMSIFMTPEQKPFFAGTYFPKTGGRGMVGFRELLETIEKRWAADREALVQSAEGLVSLLEQREEAPADPEAALLDRGLAQLRQAFDPEWGGFGQAPKFPSPCTLLFLLDRYGKKGDREALSMAETTLTRMYRGGLFDHVGWGFARYSTDRRFLVPHFEKMLYDNALLILAYARAYDLTGKSLYRRVAEKTADYVLREMTGPQGGFYSAQDADSDGVEGKYYTFTPQEVRQVLGPERGEAFNRCCGITEEGNFEGRSIPNLLDSQAEEAPGDCLPPLRAYRRQRTALHLDDKVLTAWNGLMLGALAWLYRVTGEDCWLQAALGGEAFLWEHLRQGDRLLVSFREGRSGGPGFLDDYACLAFGLLELYGATGEEGLLKKAEQVCQWALEDFRDEAHGGFCLSGRGNERLILRQKETYDGAVPSGNAMMALVLVRLARLTEEEVWETRAAEQLTFLAGAARQYPMGHCCFLLALSDYLDPPDQATVVPAPGEDARALRRRFPLDTLVTVREPSPAYRLVNGRTTCYLCRGRVCQPPTNQLPARAGERR